MDYKGAYKNLTNQIDKALKQTNFKSIKTRYRYRDACYRFCKYLAINYKLQKFKNVKDKHIIAYVEYMKKQNYSTSTILADLAGIRFYYSIINTKNELIKNSELNIQKRIIGKVDRAWSDEEFNKACQIAAQMGRDDVVKVLQLMKNFGLRVEGAVTLTVTQLKNALLFKELVVKEKGGVVRAIPVQNQKQKQIILELLKQAKWGEKIFVQKGESVFKIKQKVQKWIYNHRKEFQDQDRVKYDEIQAAKKAGVVKKSYLTAHGNRHSFAQVTFDKLIQEKYDEDSAKQITSKLLGHHRKSVTNIYLAKKDD